LKAFVWQTADLFRETCALAPHPLTVNEWNSVRLAPLDFPKSQLCSDVVTQ